MNIIYSWEFPKFKIYNNLNGLNQVVYNIEWILTASDGQGHGDMLTGSVNLSDPDPNSFIPYRSITKNQTETWVELALGDQLDELKAILQRKIESYRSTDTSTIGPPY